MNWLERASRTVQKGKVMKATTKLKAAKGTKYKEPQVPLALQTAGEGASLIGTDGIGMGVSDPPVIAVKRHKRKRPVRGNQFWVGALHSGVQFPYLFEKRGNGATYQYPISREVHGALVRAGIRSTDVALKGETA